MTRSNRPGRSSAGSRSAARFVDATIRTFAALRVGRGLAPRVGEEPVDPVDPPRLELLRSGRQVEALHLHEQFVDDADDAFAHRPGVHPAPGPADRVELLDVADRAALVAGRLAQRLEERADLLVRLPVVHRLELAGRHEQERHAGLGGHRLGEVGLAGAGQTLEQHAAAGVAAHLPLERLRREEQVHAVDRFALGLVGADDVVEADVRVGRAQQRVRRPPRREERDEDHRAEDRGSSRAR